MKKRDYAAKMAEGPRFRAANRTPGETRFRAANRTPGETRFCAANRTPGETRFCATDRTPALRRDEKVINRQESYQHAPASASKKAEGKKRRSPCTPFREKGKGKEDRRGSSWNRLSRMGARVRAALDADLDAAVLAFGGTAADRRIWASIAWRVGVEEFHFALMDKLAEDAVVNAARRPAAAFQAFLNARFPKTPPSPRLRRGKWGGAA